METSKTKKFGLSSFFWSNWYIICLYYEKKKLSLGLTLGYPVILILLPQPKYFSGYYGDDQDQDIRTQLIFLVKLVYNMSIF